MSETHHPNYFRVWAILCVLLAISIAGPFLGIRIVTLITAFGIAIVKAYLVAKHFMHLNVQPRFVVLMLGTSLAFLLLFFFGVSPDVMQDHGTGWEKPSFEYHERVRSSGAPHEESAPGEEGEEHVNH